MRDVAKKQLMKARDRPASPRIGAAHGCERLKRTAAMKNGTADP
jgi:hypothetical protein